MGGAMRKTMVYLGLVEDDERYEAYDEYDDDVRRPGTSEPAAAEQPAASDAAPARRSRRLPQRSAGRPAWSATPRSVEPEPDHDAAPAHLQRGQTIGEYFRDGTPVIMNLTDMDDADAKRLVDFAAGLVFGLHGTIERVTNKVFLLSPGARRGRRRGQGADRRRRLLQPELTAGLFAPGRSPARFHPSD